MENKLELKHLAPYLPYGLEFKINIFDQAIEKGVMEGINTKEIEFGGIRKTITESFTYEFCKPLLRPLSQLTETIEVNGVKFVPMDIISTNHYSLNKWEYIDAITWSGIPYSIDNLPYVVFELLAQWHFDIFNLIEQGLAEPIVNQLNETK